MESMVKQHFFTRSEGFEKTTYKPEGSMIVFQQIRGPQYRPHYTIILTMESPKLLTFVCKKSPYVECQQLTQALLKNHAMIIQKKLPVYDGSAPQGASGLGSRFRPKPYILNPKS